MERDFDEPEDADANRNVNHELLQELIAYVGPVRLNNEGKLCPPLFWKRNEHIYKHISTLPRVYT
jgi:hypothetical protein